MTGITAHKREIYSMRARKKMNLLTLRLDWKVWQHMHTQRLFSANLSTQIGTVL